MFGALSTAGLAGRLLSRWKFILIGVLVLALATVSYLYKDSLLRLGRQAYELTQLHQTVEDLDESVRELRMERKLMIKVVKNHQETLQNLQETRRKFRQDFREMKEELNATRNWANDRAPAAVGHWLRQQARDANRTSLPDATGTPDDYPGSLDPPAEKAD